MEACFLESISSIYLINQNNSLAACFQESQINRVQTKRIDAIDIIFELTKINLFILIRFAQAEKRKVITNYVRQPISMKQISFQP